MADFIGVIYEDMVKPQKLGSKQDLLTRIEKAKRIYPDLKDMSHQEIAQWAYTFLGKNPRADWVIGYTPQAFAKKAEILKKNVPKFEDWSHKKIIDWGFDHSETEISKFVTGKSNKYTTYVPSQLSPEEKEEIASNINTVKSNHLKITGQKISDQKATQLLKKHDNDPNQYIAHLGSRLDMKQLAIKYDKKTSPEALDFYYKKYETTGIAGVEWAEEESFQNVALSYRGGKLNSKQLSFVRKKYGSSSVYEKEMREIEQIQNAYTSYNYGKEIPWSQAKSLYHQYGSYQAAANELQRKEAFKQPYEELYGERPSLGKIGQMAQKWDSASAWEAWERAGRWVEGAAGGKSTLEAGVTAEEYMGAYQEEYGEALEPEKLQSVAAGIGDGTNLQKKLDDARKRKKERWASTGGKPSLSLGKSGLEAPTLQSNF